ncbi:hypothetical protein LTR08_005956 [Meristemomyces frigidus]|nr:hypothetical protein LTR08_005956 [Meristemomyces frigidus]
MALLALPAELRLHIYDFLPQLSPNQYETTSLDLTRQTPSICRASQQLRSETVPLYMANSEFAIQTNSTSRQEQNRALTWLHSLGTLGLPYIRNLQLNRHWSIRNPTRYEGHVGFYVRLQKADGAWQCTVGTYPVAKDTRGRRIESVELLHQALRRTVLDGIGERERQVLRVGDLRVAVESMGIVGSHPIEAFDLDQKAGGLIWASMERKLDALEASFEEKVGLLSE